MKAYLRVYDHTGCATCESIKEAVSMQLSYGWHLVNATPARAEFYDFVVTAEKTGRTDINRKPF